jgi:hypothetical protein
MRLTFALLAALALTSDPAEACKCTDPGFAADMKWADAVFVGTVTEVEMKKHCDPKVPESWDWCTKSYHHRMTVDGVWKGAVPKQVELHAAGGCGDCSYGGSLGKGKRWLIFVKGSGASFQMRICSGIQPASTWAMKVMTDRFGAPKPPTN